MVYADRHFTFGERNEKGAAPFLYWVRPTSNYTSRRARNSTSPGRQIKRRQFNGREIYVSEMLKVLGGDWFGKVLKFGRSELNSHALSVWLQPPQTTSPGAHLHDSRRSNTVQLLEIYLSTISGESSLIYFCLKLGQSLAGWKAKTPLHQVWLALNRLAPLSLIES